MTKHDRLFLAILVASIALIGAIMTGNINDPVTPSGNAATNLRASEARQKIIDLKLPLHEAQYWKETHE